MPRFTRHIGLGLRWLGCGGRLFRRNPWLFGGMGLCAAVVVSLLSLIPLLGGPLITGIVPIVLASYYLAIDQVSKSSVPFPSRLRMLAIRQSPRELVGVFRQEKRVIPMVIVSLYGMIVSLLTSTFIWLIAGSTWTKPLASLGSAALLSVLAATLFALVVYFLFALSIVYALPRTFLSSKPLFPEIARSTKAGMHYLVALLTVLGTLLAPILIGTLISLKSVWLGYVVYTLTNAVALPLVATGLYCSYRTIFPSHPASTRS